MVCHSRPRDIRADVVSQRWSHVTDTTQGDDDGIDAVDARYDHDRCCHQQHQNHEYEEGREGDQSGSRHVLPVDSDRQHGIGVQTLTEVVANHPSSITQPMMIHVR